MKKILLAAALLVGAVTVNAQNDEQKDYNRVGISYNYTNASFNAIAKMALPFDGVGLNGVGVDYIHGFSLSSKLPMYIETGINYSYNLGSKDVVYEDEDPAKYEAKFQGMNFQIPVNYVYRYAINDNMTLAPYVGLNFKLHLTAKAKSKYVDPDDSANDEESEWFNLFDKADMSEAFEDEVDKTLNRFQMGWHVGVGFQYKPFYVALQYGTDFLPLFSQDTLVGKAKINTGNLKLSFAYSF